MSESLDHLLAAYRTASLSGATRERVRLVRKILHLDTGNPTWEEDLRALERRHRDELAAEIEQRAGRADWETLFPTLDELLGSEWTERPAAALRSRALRAAGRRLIPAIAQAHAALDFDALERHLARWERIERDGAWRPEGAETEQVSDARAWRDQERARREEERAYRADLDAVERAVEDARRPHELEAALLRLDRHGRDVPEAVRLRARARLESLNLAAARRFRLVLAGVLSFALLIVGILAWTASRLTRDEAIEAASARIEGNVGSADLAAAREELAGAKAEFPEWNSIPRLSALDADVSRKSARAAELRVGIDGIAAKIESHKITGFPDETAVQVEDWLKQAEEIDGELRKLDRGSTLSDHLASLRDAFQSARDGRERDKRNSFDDLCGKINKKVLEFNPKARSAQGDLIQLDTLWAEAKAAKNLNAGRNEQLNDLKKRIDDAKNWYQETARKTREQELLFNQLGNALPDIEKYLDAIDDAVKNDIDGPLAQQFRPVRDRQAYYRHAVRGAGWTPEGLDLASEVETLLGGVNREKNVWWDALERHKAFLAGDKALLQSAMTALDKLKEFNGYYNLKSVTAYPAAPIGLQFNPGNLKVFHFYEFPARNVKNQVGTFVYYRYQGGILDGTINLKPDGEFFHHLEPAALKRQANDVPHSAYLRSLEERIRSVEPAKADRFLWAEVHELAAKSADNQINPVVAKRIAYEWLVCLEAQPPLLGPASKAIRDSWIKPTDVYWLLEGDAEAKRSADQARSEFKQLLNAGNKTIEDMERALRERAFHRTLLRAALGRRVGCVGRVRLPEGGGPIWDVRKTEGVEELWILDVNVGSNTGRFAVAATRETGRKAGDPPRFTACPLPPGVSLTDGEPLFAPADGKTTSALLAEIAKEAGLDRDNVNNRLASDWPDAWPANARWIDAR